MDFNYNIAIDTYQLAQRAWPNLGRWCMEDLRDLLDIQNDDAHRVLADCEDEMAVYNAIRNGVKSGELSVEPPRRRASRPGNRAIWSRLSRSYSYDIAPRSPMCQIKNDAMAMIKHTADAATAPFFLSFSPTNRVAVK